MQGEGEGERVVAVEMADGSRIEDVAAVISCTGIAAAQSIIRGVGHSNHQPLGPRLFLTLHLLSLLCFTLADC